MPISSRSRIGTQLSDGSFTNGLMATVTGFTQPRTDLSGNLDLSHRDRWSRSYSPAVRVDVECPSESADDPDEDEHVDLEDVEGEGDAGWTIR